jgi:hypothetical protein
MPPLARLSALARPDATRRVATRAAIASKTAHEAQDQEIHFVASAAPA